MTKRLYRSKENKVIGGVCGGIGEYFELDPVLIRIITVLLMMAPGIGVIAYIIGWIIIPARPETEPLPKTEYQFSSWNKYIPGLILIAIGIILLVRENLYWFNWDDYWPVILILAGAFLIFRRRKNNAIDEYHVNNQAPENSDLNHNGGGAV